MFDRSQTILMIDDDTNDAFLTKRIFSKYAPPVKIIHCSDASIIYDDVELICTKKMNGPHLPDFIFLDINMPKANGLDLLKRLKAHEKIKMIPVLVLTTSEFRENVECAYANGAAAYIVKPTTMKAYGEFASAFMNFWCNSTKRPELN